MQRFSIPAVIAVLIMLAPVAVARDWELDGGLGYSQLRFSGAQADLDGSGDIYGRVGLSFSPRRWDERLRIGAGVSFVSHNAMGAPVANQRVQPGGGFGFGFGPNITDHEWNRLRLIAPEITLSWRHYVTETVFVEPGLGAVVLLGRYETGVRSGGGWFGGVGASRTEQTRTRTGLGLRPGVKLGLQRSRESRWRFGLETSYLFGRLDFGDGVGGSIGEFRAGVFIALDPGRR
jgi:opacity protein-like surface antigen